MVAVCALARPLVLSIALLGCGGGTQASAGVRPPRVPGQPLPVYTRHQAELFDDAIEPAAIGYELGPAVPTPMSSSLLRERAQVGDAVVRARLTTITSKETQPRHEGWQLSFRTVEPLTDWGWAETDFSVQVPPTGSSVGLLRAFEERLVGTTFVVFVREFLRSGAPAGESDLHFHAAPDATADVAAVRAAITVSEVRKTP